VVVQSRERGGRGRRETRVGERVSVRLRVSERVVCGRSPLSDLDP
jgi:hypothetical protein